MIGLMLGPLGRYALVALAVVVLLGGIYLWGRSDGAARVELRVQREVAAEQVRQRAAAAASLEEAARAAEAAEAENRETQGRVAALLADLGARTDQCTIGDDDAAKLNAIR
jgi:hypothetical protein